MSLTVSKELSSCCFSYQFNIQTAGNAPDAVHSRIQFFSAYFLHVENMGAAICDQLRIMVITKIMSFLSAAVSTNPPSAAYVGSPVRWSVRRRSGSTFLPALPKQWRSAASDRRKETSDAAAKLGQVKFRYDLLHLVLMSSAIPSWISSSTLSEKS